MTRKKRGSIFGTGWKGGSFKATVGGWLGRKVKRVRAKVKKSLTKGAKSAVGIKPRHKRK